MLLVVESSMFTQQTTRGTQKCTTFMQTLIELYNSGRI